MHCCSLFQLFLQSKFELYQRDWNFQQLQPSDDEMVGEFFVIFISTVETIRFQKVRSLQQVKAAKRSMQLERLKERFLKINNAQNMSELFSSKNRNTFHRSNDVRMNQKAFYMAPVRLANYSKSFEGYLTEPVFQKRI